MWNENRVDIGIDSIEVIALVWLAESFYLSFQGAIFGDLDFSSCSTSL